MPVYDGPLSRPSIDINIIWEPLKKKSHHVPEIPISKNPGIWQKDCSGKKCNINKNRKHVGLYEF